MIFNTRSTLVWTCYSFFFNFGVTIWENLRGVSEGTSWNISYCSWCWFEAVLHQYQLFNIPDWSWNQGFFFFFSPCLACVVSGTVLWVVWIFNVDCWFSTSRGTRIDDETLQNFINDHTVDLENILILFINFSQNYAHTDPTTLWIRISIIMLGYNFQIAQLPQHQCLPRTW